MLELRAEKKAVIQTSFLFFFSTRTLQLTYTPYGVTCSTYRWPVLRSCRQRPLVFSHGECIFIYYMQKCSFCTAAIRTKCIIAVFAFGFTNMASIVIFSILYNSTWSRKPYYFIFTLDFFFQYTDSSLCAWLHSKGKSKSWIHIVRYYEMLSLKAWYYKLFNIHHYVHLIFTRMESSFLFFFVSKHIYRITYHSRQAGNKLDRVLNLFFCDLHHSAMFFF